MTRQEESRRYYLKHKKEVQERVKKYREKHRELIRKKDREKYASNDERREKIKQYQREYRRNNKEKVNAYNRRYMKAGYLQKHNEMKREWAKTPKGKLLSQTKSYRRRSLLKDIGRHTVEEWETAVSKHRNKCAICKKKRKLTKDHIIPLTKGGMNTIDNIQPLCLPCNARKGNSIHT